MIRTRGIALFIVLAAVALAAAVFIIERRQPPSLPGEHADFPDARQFQTGDLLWPKKKGAIIPYSASAPPDAELIEWEKQHRLLLDAAEAPGVPPQVAERLRALTYEQYREIYFGDPPQGNQPQVMRAGTPTVAVGHVAIIDVERGGDVFVIEATPAPQPGSIRGAIVRLPYKDWLAGRKDYQVWHGRLDKGGSDDRAKVVTVARAQVGKPYAFFNFDLNDDSGFYCSKLVWMSVWRALNIALDGNANSDRRGQFPPWFSPRQLANSPDVRMLHKPGEY